jgi:hypothetical protein
LWWTEFHRVFPLFLSASTVAAYIFTAPTCKATIVSLKPCALNADFKHFILRFIKFPYFMDTSERRVWGGERRPKDRMTSQIILIFTLNTPQNIYIRSCKCIWQMLTLPSHKCKIYIYTLQQDKCKCKEFGHISVNNLHLHWIYMLYISLLIVIHTTLV